MNVFDKIQQADFAELKALGKPLNDPIKIEQRLTLFANVRNGNGFRTSAKSPKKNAQGLTRGDRKRIARERTNAKIMEERNVA